jgi:hypothetical protein
MVSLASMFRSGVNRVCEEVHFAHEYLRSRFEAASEMVSVHNLAALSNRNSQEVALPQRASSDEFCSSSGRTMLR